MTDNFLSESKKGENTEEEERTFLIKPPTERKTLGQRR